MFPFGLSFVSVLSVSSRFGSILYHRLFHFISIRLATTPLLCHSSRRFANPSQSWQKSASHTFPIFSPSIRYYTPVYVFHFISLSPWCWAMFFNPQTVSIVDPFIVVESLLRVFRTLYTCSTWNMYLFVTCFGPSPMMQSWRFWQNYRFTFLGKPLRLWCRASVRRRFPIFSPVPRTLF